MHEKQIVLSREWRGLIRVFKRELADDPRPPSMLRRAGSVSRELEVLKDAVGFGGGPSQTQMFLVI